MLGQLFRVLIGGIALVIVGVFSYISLENTFGPREAIQAVVQPTLNQKSKVESVTSDAVKATNTPAVAVTKKTSTRAPVTIKTNGSLVPVKVVIEKTVVTPGPLRIVAPVVTPVIPTPKSALTIRGIIEYTNGARSQNGALPALTENELLNRDAKLKLDDMFAKQYFEHDSPTGVGPADLAKTVGYAYVIVGENLALGDFGSDEGVVTAWMNSPGHRANILNAHYQEIGVAVGMGMYDGHETWIAVQSFGMPLSACPPISADLKTQIDSNNAQIAILRAQLDSKKVQIESTSPNDPNYNVYVGEFNAILPEYNLLAESTRVFVLTYNTSVQAFNSCINSAEAH